jgi:ATP-dependent RNA helicase RhlE
MYKSILFYCEQLSGSGTPWLVCLPKGPVVSFEKFAFHPFIQAGISSAGYSTPTPIQAQTIQPVIDGRDVLGLAQTGTGKTAAFVYHPATLLRRPRSRLRALILYPELAEQTHSVISLSARPAAQCSVYAASAPGQIKPYIAVLKSVACPTSAGPYGTARIQFGRSGVGAGQADMMFDMGSTDIRRIMSAITKGIKRLFQLPASEIVRTWTCSKIVTVELRANR